MKESTENLNEELHVAIEFPIHFEDEDVEDGFFSSQARGIIRGVYVTEEEFAEVRRLFEAGEDINTASCLPAVRHRAFEDGNQIGIREEDGVLSRWQLECFLRFLKSRADAK